MCDNWSVYYHQNKQNGKIYVGITSIAPELRWGKEGSHYSHSPHFCAAVRKSAKRYERGVQNEYSHSGKHFKFITHIKA